MKVVAYCRVSTDSRDQLNSYENQMSYFDREIEARGHKSLGIYADRGLTGTAFDNRPELERMLIDAGLDVNRVEDRMDKRIKARHTIYEISDRAPKFEEIWLKNTSRFARNTLSYEIIQKLRTKHVYLYFIEQNINTRDVSQDLLLKLMQVFDEQDSKDKSLKTTFGRKEAAKQGVVFTNGKLYGYRYNMDKNSLEAIPEEAAVVRLIFDLYEKKMGARRITNFLEEQGYRTRKGKPFFTTTIRRILANEKYAGLNNPQKYDKGKVFEKSYVIRINAEYQVEPSDRIEAIITPEQFYRCKELLKTSVNYRMSVGKYTGLTKYNSLIFCGHCGAVYYSNVESGRRFYVCSTKKKYGVKSCGAKNISEITIDHKVSELMNGDYKRMVNILGNNLLHSLYNILNNLTERYGHTEETELYATREELQNEEEKRKRYLSLYGERTGDDVMLEEFINQSKERIEKLKAKITKLENPKKAMQDDLHLILESIKEVQLFIAEPSPATESDMIDKLSRIDIYEGMPQYNIKLPSTLKKFRERFGDDVFASEQPITDNDLRKAIDIAKRTILGNVS